MVAEVFAQTDRLVEKDQTDIFYFVAAHTDSGARFYSEPFENIVSEATDAFKQYKDVVEYFGGGIVELFKIDQQDFDIIAVSRV